MKAGDRRECFRQKNGKGNAALTPVSEHQSRSTTRAVLTLVREFLNPQILPEGVPNLVSMFSNLRCRTAPGKG